MVNFLVFLLMIIGGVSMGVQASVNGQLSNKIGTLEAALVNFTTGILVLALLVIFMGKGNLSAVSTVPKWQLTGGLLGVIVITTIIIGVPKIGAASTMFTMIGGQVLISVIIDHYGLFGVPQISLDWQRILGVVLMGASLFLIFRSSVTL